ncbi:hypothetical protein UVI_02053520 [Ustilaginoidea virens]|uniref:Uncharacterized protein n=1 Tax=Ustilaginoidea virens TaxID=1159556 RepID=A0A1B5L0F3_USTVR|nr:hypothetical protein UVI_02053520 [Ustilaginoidea virens]
MPPGAPARAARPPGPPSTTQPPQSAGSTATTVATAGASSSSGRKRKPPHGSEQLSKYAKVDGHGCSSSGGCCDDDHGEGPSTAAASTSSSSTKKRKSRHGSEQPSKYAKVGGHGSSSRGCCEDDHGEGPSTAAASTSSSSTKKRKSLYGSEQPSKHAKRPCDRTSLKDKYFLECQNCSDFRFLTGDTSHKCQTDRKQDAWQRYSTHHPAEYPVNFYCSNCESKGWQNTCDADPFLNLKCSSCVTGCQGGARASASASASASATTTAKGKGKGKGKGKARAGPGLKPPDDDGDDGYGDGEDCEFKDRRGIPCFVHGIEMGPKPNLRQGFPRWFRQACDICKNLNKKSIANGCSWLKNRLAWDVPCDRCRERSMACMRSGLLVLPPGAVVVVVLPDLWCSSHKLNEGWAECRGSSPYRKNCVACVEGKHHCRAMAQQIEYSCAMCFQMGIVCRDVTDPDKFYPLLDLSRVGIGNFCAFSKCRNCREAGRNCDRQRPCDSCVAHGDLDCCSLKDSFNCIKRLDTPPGPVYYLALGYGAEGVDDEKDGSQLEHWIGPLFALYAIDGKPPGRVRKNKAAAGGSSSGMGYVLGEVDDDGTGIIEGAGAEAEAAGADKAPAAAARPSKGQAKSAPAPQYVPRPMLNKMTLSSAAEAMRTQLLPPGPPPLATDPVFGGRRIDQLSVDDLRQWIRLKWKDAYPPNQHPKWNFTVGGAKEALENARRAEETGFDVFLSNPRPRPRPRPRPKYSFKTRSKSKPKPNPNPTAEAVPEEEEEEEDEDEDEEQEQEGDGEEEEEEYEEKHQDRQPPQPARPANRGIARQGQAQGKHVLRAQDSANNGFFVPNPRSGGYGQAYNNPVDGNGFNFFTDVGAGVGVGVGVGVGDFGQGPSRPFYAGNQPASASASASAILGPNANAIMPWIDNFDECVLQSGIHNVPAAQPLLRTPTSYQQPFYFNPGIPPPGLSPFPPTHQSYMPRGPRMPSSLPSSNLAPWPGMLVPPPMYSVNNPENVDPRLLNLAVPPPVRFPAPAPLPTPFAGNAPPAPLPGPFVSNAPMPFPMGIMPHEPAGGAPEGDVLGGAHIQPCPPPPFHAAFPPPHSGLHSTGSTNTGADDVIHQGLDDLVWPGLGGGR